MSDPQRPEREAIEQAITTAWMKWAKALPPGAFTHPDGVKAIQMLTEAVLAALPPTPTPGIETFWREVERGWDIEDRAWFELHYKSRGYPDPITMAVHHMWKRKTKDRS
jgi:hypothetical protein